MSQNSINPPRRRGRQNDSSDAPRVEPEGRRRRGAQPGNLNALKHGRYLTSDNFGDVMPLDSSHLSDLGIYIVMIKKFMRITYEEGLHATSLEEVRETLHLLSLAGLSITRLVNLQRRVNRNAGALTPERT